MGTHFPPAATSGVYFFDSVSAPQWKAFDLNLSGTVVSTILQKSRIAPTHPSEKVHTERRP